MPGGNTTTDALADSLPTVIASARIVREFSGAMSQLVERQTLGEGNGLDWTEVSLAQLTAQAVTEQTVLDNPQQLVDTKFSIRPTDIGIHTVFTDRVAARISKNAFARTGELTMNAIVRKKDEDGLVALAAATTSLCGAGNTLASGHIRAGARRITSNTVEPAMGALRCVLHGYQLKDIEDEMVAGVGTDIVQDGPTANVFTDGFSGRIGKATIYEDGNISIDANDDATGGVFSSDALVLVQGRGLRSPTRREPQIGGGATSLWIYDEYAYGERSAGNWLFAIKSDATAPTN